MKIPLNEISTAGLFKLLRDVSAELEARMSAPVYHRVRDVLPLKTLRVPAETGRSRLANARALTTQGLTHTQTPQGDTRW